MSGFQAKRDKLGQPQTYIHGAVSKQSLLPQLQPTSFHVSPHAPIQSSLQLTSCHRRTDTEPDLAKWSKTGYKPQGGYKLQGVVHTRGGRYTPISSSFLNVIN